MKAYVHIGAGKTGTSAIQVALERKRAALREVGIHYPAPPSGGVQRAAAGLPNSGNAYHLARLLRPARREDPPDIPGARTMLEGMLAGAEGRDVLLSSEFFQSLGAKGAEPLLGMLADRGYEPVVIFYVRHLLDHALSEYLQFLKVGFAGYPTPGSDFSLGGAIRRYRCKFVDSLAPFAERLPREALVVRLYDAEVDTLLPGFFRIFTTRLAVENEREQVVNRSPTPAEAEIFFRLAALPDGQRLCRQLTDLVLNRPGPRTARFTVATEDFAEFEKRNAPLVAKVNARYLPPEQRLLLTSGRIEVGRVEPVSAEALAEAFTEGFATALRRSGPGAPPRAAAAASPRGAAS